MAEQVCGTGGWGGPKPGDPDNNVILSAAPAFGGIDVSWSYPGVNPHAVAHTMLYRSTSGTEADPTLYTIVSGNFFYDKTTSATPIEYFYWIRIVSINGTIGELIGPASSVARPTMAEVLLGLSQRIDASHLAESLRTPIEQIAVIELALAEERSKRLEGDGYLGEAFNEVLSSMDDLRDSMLAEADVRVADNATFVDHVNQLAQEIGSLLTVTEGLGLSIDDVRERADALEADVSGIHDRNDALDTRLVALQDRAESLEGGVEGLLDRAGSLETGVDNLIDRAGSLEDRAINTETGISSLRDLQREQDQISAIEYLAIQATMSGNQAGVIDESVIRVTEDQALSSRITTVTADMVAQDQTLRALVESEKTALVNADTALAASREQLAAQMRGTYTGSDLTKLTSGMLFQERQARVMLGDSLVEQISLLSAGVGEQFDPLVIYHFDSASESWTGNGVPPTVENGWLVPPSVVTPYVTSPTGMSIDSTQYNQVRLRIRRVGEPDWLGLLEWRLTGDTNWQSIDLTEPTYDENGIGLVIANPAWAGSVDRIRLTLSSVQTAENGFRIDWVSIGRPSPGASSAALATEQQARAQADAAEVSARETLTTTLIGEADPIDATLPTLTSGLIYEERQVRSSETAAISSRMDSMDSTVTTQDTNLKALIASEAQTQATATQAVASDVSALQSTVNTKDTQVRGLISNEATTRSSADTALSGRVDTLSSTVNTNNTQVRGLITTEQNTRANAVSALSDRVDTVSASVETVDSDVRALIATSEQASATADAVLLSQLNALSGEVTTKDTAVRSLVADEVAVLVTADGALSTRIDTVTTELATKDTAVRALVDEEVSTLVAVDEAATSRMNAMESQITTVDTDLRSLVTTEIETVTTANSTLASQVEILESTLTQTDIDVRAMVGTEIGTLVEADSALSERLDTLSVSLEGTNASIDASNLARVTEDQALAHSIEGVQANVDATGARITDEVGALALVDAALASRISTIETEGAYDDTDVRALISTEEQARITEDEALASRIDLQASTITEGDDEIRSLVMTETETLTTELSALASQQTLLTGQLGEANGSITGVRRVLAAADYIQAVEMAMLEAKYAGNTAGIYHETYTRSTQEESVAGEISSLQAQTDANKAAIDTEIQVRTTEKEATTAQFTAMQSQVATNLATVLNSYETAVTAKAARANLQQAIQTNYEDHVATVLTDYETHSDSVAARASLKTTLQSAFQTSLSSALTSYQTAAQAAASRASMQSTITTGYQGMVTGVQQTLSADITRINGEVVNIGSQYTATLTAGGLIGGFGVYNDGKSVLAGFDVDTFFLGRSAADGMKPFVMEGSEVFIKEAAIKSLTFNKLKADDGSFIVKNGKVSASFLELDFAEVSGMIQSNNYVPGSAGWRLDKGGVFEVNGSVAGQGRFTMTKDGIKIYDGNNRLRVQLGNLNS